MGKIKTLLNIQNYTIPSVDPHFFIVLAEAPLGVCLAELGALERGVKFELSITCDFGLSVLLGAGVLNGLDGKILFCAVRQRNIGTESDQHLLPV